MSSVCDVKLYTDFNRCVHAETVIARQMPAYSGLFIITMLTWMSPCDGRETIVDVNLYYLRCIHTRQSCRLTHGITASIHGSVTHVARCAVTRRPHRMLSSPINNTSRNVVVSRHGSPNDIHDPVLHRTIGVRSSLLGACCNKNVNSLCSYIHGMSIGGTQTTNYLIVGFIQTKTLTFYAFI